MPKGSAERRKYLRIEAQIALRIIAKSGFIDTPDVKNISPLGLAFESKKEYKTSEPIELTINLPKSKNPVHVNGKVIWQKKTSFEDNAPYIIGCEFNEIEEDNKNTFLKYLCDMMYAQKIKH